MDLDKFIVKSVRNDELKGIKYVELENGPKLELKQYWYETLIDVGDSVAIGIDEQPDNDQSMKDVSIDQNLSVSDDLCELAIVEQEKRTIIIETANNFLVVNPDYLITSTDLSNAGFCHRKTWLGNRFKFYCEPDYWALLGTLIHCLFQDTVSEQNLTKKQLDDIFSKLIRQPWVLRTLVVLKKTEDNLLRDSREYVANIIRFNRKFSSTEPVSFDNNQPNLKIKINKVTDIEDLILAYNYGIKGKIDVTMNVELHDSRTNEIKVHNQLTPFELKTGKVSYSYAHQAQVSLYTLIIDNSTNRCNFGLLAYLKGDVSMKYISMTRFVRNDLLMQRNELVHYFKYLATGPKTRSNITFCGRCEHLLDCCLLGKLYEPDKIASFTEYQPELVTETLAHLTENQLDFFKNWINMIHLEERTSYDKRIGCFWNNKANDLERSGRAIAKLCIHSIENQSYEYKFKRVDKFRSLGPLPVDIQFHRNVDRVTLSLENGDGKLEKIAFINGVIVFIDENYVTVQLDEHIKEDYLNKIFRLDILHIQSNLSNLFTSMLCLMGPEPNAQFLRELIIDNRLPMFDSSIKSSIIESMIKDLNTCQQKAVRRSLEARDYLLINGYPGSGKTETIVCLVKIFAQMNKTIVITAHTNQAVDNILLKLIQHQDIRFMRIGNLSRINPDLIGYSEDNLIRNCTSTEQIKQLYTSINIYAGTCYSLNSHMIYKIKSIEYCLVDEASQLNLPENLLPLFNSQKFILVGDPNQLTPIVNSSKAKAQGYDRTLFEILMQGQGDRSVELTIQYRMNSEIMRIANHCTYDNKLTCGSDEIANATLQLLDLIVEGNDEQSISQSWMDKCLSSELQNSVLFLNTDDHHYSNDELNSSDEVNILIKIVNELLAKHIDQSEIGIITFYQRQMKTLRSSFTGYPDIEVSTIDQYQGRDKSIILISCVKFNVLNEQTKINANGILNDNSRLNVAITRSKKKLVLVGSLTTLNNYKPFIRLFSSLKPNQIISV